ncbi:MAG: DUF4167 domain-containing protein [Alphaproteobacteria bacterium]|nr:DUF4167 domain-containing protein [Alphaproteobacteria bacterium]
MRQTSPGTRRPRGRHNSGGGNAGGGQPSGGSMRGGNGGGGDNRLRSASSLRHQTFDSNGPDVRVRGNAWQVYEKYQSLARDATSSGDRVMAENYQQHAEHYYRITEAIEEAAAAEQRQRGGSSASSFGGQQQQPEVPSNYYTQDGQLTAGVQPQPQLQPQQPQQPQSQPQSQSQSKPDAAGGVVSQSRASCPVASAPVKNEPSQPKQEASVDVRRRAPAPVQASTALFPAEENEDTDSSPQTLVAQR